MVVANWFREDIDACSLINLLRVSACVNSDRDGSLD